MRREFAIAMKLFCTVRGKEEEKLFDTASTVKP